MSRSAWVIHISAVTLAQTTRNAPDVVRKIYRPMDPIRLRVPARAATPNAHRSRACAPSTPISAKRRDRRRRAPKPVRHSDGNSIPFYPLLARETKWPRQGKAFEHAQQNVNSRALPPGNGGVGGAFGGDVMGGALQARWKRSYLSSPAQAFLGPTPTPKDHLPCRVP